jgi:hypothetical protein
MHVNGATYVGYLFEDKNMAKELKNGLMAPIMKYTMRMIRKIAIDN